MSSPVTDPVLDKEVEEVLKPKPKKDTTKRRFTKLLQSLESVKPFKDWKVSKLKTRLTELGFKGHSKMGKDLLLMLTAYEEKRLREKQEREDEEEDSESSDDEETTREQIAYLTKKLEKLTDPKVGSKRKAAPKKEKEEKKKESPKKKK